jgi:hypothetical protein
MNKLNTLIDSIIEQSRGRFLTVTFRKNNGEIRTINGRVGVNFRDWPADHRFDSEGTQTYYFLIWSVRDRGFRRINAENVIRIASQGTVLYTEEPVGAGRRMAA